MDFFRALAKLIKRKKVKGYYNSEDMISSKEKQGLIIGFSIIAVPLLIAVVLISLG